jgi:hypothetical protein
MEFMLTLAIISPSFMLEESVVQAWGRSHYIIFDKCYVSLMLQKFCGAKEKKSKIKKIMMRRKEKYGKKEEERKKEREKNVKEIK